MKYSDDFTGKVNDFTKKVNHSSVNDFTKKVNHSSVNDFTPRNVVRHRTMDDDRITPLRDSVRVTPRTGATTRTGLWPLYEEASRPKPVFREDTRKPYEVVDDKCPFCKVGTSYARTNDGGSILQCDKCLVTFNNVNYRPMRPEFPHQRPFNPVSFRESIRDPHANVWSFNNSHQENIEYDSRDALL